MDNQKSTEGKGINATNAGSSIGKSQDSSLNKNTTQSSGSQQSASSPSSASSSSASPSSSLSSNSQSASSSGNLGASSSTGTGSLGTSSVTGGSTQGTTAGNSGLGNSGSSASAGTGSASGSTSTSGSSASGSSSDNQSSDKESTVGGIKAAISSISPDKVHDSIDKAGQAAQPLVDSLVSKAHAGVDKVTGLLGTAQEKFGDRSTQLTEKYSDLSAQGKEYVKNNPGSALLAAVGVGFILAKLLGGSSDRHEYRNYRDYRD